MTHAPEGLTLHFTKRVTLKDLAALWVLWEIECPDTEPPELTCLAKSVTLAHSDVKALIRFVESFHGRGWEVTKD